MKTWQIVLIVGGVVIVGALVLMKAQTPKANPVNSSFPTPNTAINGLGAAIGGFIAQIGQNKPPQTPYFPNQGTYQTGFVPVQSGNTLVDPNTGSALNFGTD